MAETVAHRAARSKGVSHQGQFGADEVPGTLSLTSSTDLGKSCGLVGPPGQAWWSVPLCRGARYPPSPQVCPSRVSGLHCGSKPSPFPPSLRPLVGLATLPGPVEASGKARSPFCSSLNSSCSPETPQSSVAASRGARQFFSPGRWT